VVVAVVMGVCVGGLAAVLLLRCNKSLMLQLQDEAATAKNRGVRACICMCSCMWMCMWMCMCMS